MKSTIKVRLDSERRAIIMIEQSKDTTDTRDWLVADFVESLGHKSQFAFLEFHATSQDHNFYTITPVTPERLEELRDRVNETLKVNAVHDKMLHH